MADPMLQLVRQLSLQVSLLEKENQRLRKETRFLQVQLGRCLKIIDALRKHLPL
jgi:hypothetical protein